VADIASAINAGWGVAFLVAAGVVFEIIAAACSSPQTAEINAGSRAKTLMKWVYIGVGLAVFFVLIAAAIEAQRAAAFLAGGGLAAVIMLMLYQHAKQAGLRSAEPGTEH